MLSKLIKKWFSTISYQSDIESFILSRNPQDICDVERLMKEYNYKTLFKGDCHEKN
jgi:hypothetical protein